MIVPRNRLLFWFAVIVLPFALLAAVEPAVATLAMLVIAVFLLVVVADATTAPRSLAGLGLELPPVVRFSKDRGGKLEVRVRNPRQTPRLLRLALALPRQIESPQEDATVALPAGSEWSRISWRCVPRRRGNYRLSSASLEVSSPLGFWDARRLVPASCEIRVYPNLFTGRRDLAALFLRRGAFGLHAQRQLGKGREFEKLREYVPGDSYDEIHWKATAKRGHPITKVFQIERTQEVYVVIDSSRLSARATTHDLASTAKRSTKSGLTPELAEASAAAGEPTAALGNTALERFITAGLLLGLAAEQQGDLFGLLTFTDKVERFVRAKNGKPHYSACRDALYLLEPRIVTPDFDEVCSFIRLRLRRRALLVFLTALDDPALAESFVRNMDLIRRQHLVLVNMLQPTGVEPLFSDPAVGSVDDLYQRLGGHLQWQNLRELQKVLQRRGVQFNLLSHENLATEIVSQYLSVKRRQAL
jgi:uncharacterized protein (DUF58 family)